MSTFKPPSEMVERVGEALSAAFMEEFGETLRRGERQKLARAAIEAMREPTDAMLATEEIQQTAVHRFMVRADKQIWQAMIDAAL